ncbi:MAG: hypothetical protein H6712_13990 [Myxococcales bacterium]|nr:hypothetical protein [Myxococcales bacterium]MCB9714973.1 hypothetical protein [Myxococcales bacterium]
MLPLLLVTACTGRGVDRSDAVPLRAALEIRPIVDGDPFEEVLAETAQGTRPLPEHVSPYAPLEVEVEHGELGSPVRPPIPTTRVVASSRATLEQALRQAGPVPAGRAVVYEQQPDERWTMLVVDTTEGLVLGPDTGLTLGEGEPGSGYEGVFLLLPPQDAQTFERLTRDHQGGRLAIIEGDEVLLAPTVQEPVPGGTVLITPGTNDTPASTFERLAGRPAPAPAEAR